MVRDLGFGIIIWVKCDYHMDPVSPYGSYRIMHVPFKIMTNRCADKDV